jgi:dolichol-phosphate mannosyltransferase
VPEISIIIPTYNERGNLTTLLDSLAAALPGVDYEVVIVDDDSPDGTSALARSLAQHNRRVRALQRVGRRGLSSATVEGMLATSSPYIAVMDGDLQHDERILPQMVAKLKNENLDIVIGSRHTDGGSMGEFAAGRAALSDLGRRLSQAICRAKISDPMSGYFLLTRDYLQEVVHSLSCIGFKILLDLIASSHRPVRIGEVGYTFRNRLHGESKLDIIVGLEYVQFLVDKAMGGWLPVSYLIFSMVGAVGLVVNWILVYVLLHSFPLSFDYSQALASFLVIGLNFALNNKLTFRAARLRGMRWLQGLGLFYLASSVGLAFNLAAAHGFRDFGVPWYAASLTGVAIGSIWNYWVTSLFIWKIGRRRAGHLRAAYDVSLSEPSLRRVPAIDSSLDLPIDPQEKEKTSQTSACH